MSSNLHRPAVLRPLLALTFALAATPSLAAPAFEDVTAASGLDFVHFNGMSGRTLLPETVGSGVAMFDLSGFDHDQFNLRFSFGSGTASTAEGINIDNVKITGDCINGGTDPNCQPPGTGVPEPASLALAALGLTVMYRRRSKAI